MIELTDIVVLDAPRITADGYLATEARVARTGVQVYLGSELGMKDRTTVRVWRPEEEVFKADAIRSYAHRPVTVGHPKGLVTADNWKEVSVGQTGDEVVRDGQFVRVPMVLMDKAAIDAVIGGSRELSMGYSCKIEVTDGVTPEGEPYDAIQRNLRMNHLAIVAMARGGAQLRIGDETSKEEKMTDNVHKTRTVLVDGLSVETTDAGAVAIQKLQKDLADAQAAAEKATRDHSAALAAKDAEIDKLGKKVMTDAEIDARVAVRARLCETARKIDPKVVTDGKTDADIRRAVVDTKIGDAAKGKDDTYIEVRFDILAEDAGKADPVREAAASGSGHKMMIDAKGVADVAYAESLKEMSAAWQGNASKGN